MKLVHLFETIDNFFIRDTKSRKQYADRVFDVLTQSYKSIGGLKGEGFTSPQDMIDHVPMWKVARRGEDVKAVMMYKDTNGRKCVAMGTDGTPEGKRMLFGMIKEELSQARSYAELSGPALKAYKRIAGSEYDNYLIPAKDVAKILGKEIKLTDDHYEYQRMIGDNMATKVMMGTPGNTIK